MGVLSDLYNDVVGWGLDVLDWDGTFDSDALEGHPKECYYTEDFIEWVDGQTPDSIKQIVTKILDGGHNINGNLTAFALNTFCVYESELYDGEFVEYLLDKGLLPRDGDFFPQKNGVEVSFNITEDGKIEYFAFNSSDIHVPLPGETTEPQDTPKPEEPDEPTIREIGADNRTRLAAALKME